MTGGAILPAAKAARHLAHDAVGEDEALRPGGRGRVARDVRISEHAWRRMFGKPNAARRTAHQQSSTSINDLELPRTSGTARCDAVRAVAMTA